MEYRRNYQAGGVYFFTVVTQSRRPILIEHITRLRQAFREAKARYPFEIDAAVILPDHLHTIWRLPEGDNDYSRRWMVLKRLFSSGLVPGALTESQQGKREKGIWQRRFWEHTIRDEADWRRHMDYLHYNPVKHGYVRHRASGRTDRSGERYMRECMNRIGARVNRSSSGVWIGSDGV